jgi:acyl transferase domain-containing protein
VSQVPTTPTAWPEQFPRRASVNNFGYGGANAHAILEAAPVSPAALGTLATGGTNITDADTHGDHATGQHRIFVLSSKDYGVTQRMMKDLATFVDPDQTSTQSLDLARLAYTLNERRSRYPWRCAVAANSTSGLASALRSVTLKPVQARTAPRIGFVFTGQGAQWATMGRELFAYPEFACAMREADDVLRSYGANWSLVGKTQPQGSDHTTMSTS